MGFLFTRAPLYALICVQTTPQITHHPPKPSVFFTTDGLSCPSCRHPFPKSPLALFDDSGWRFVRVCHVLRERGVRGELGKAHYDTMRDEIQVNQNFEHIGQLDRRTNE